MDLLRVFLFLIYVLESSYARPVRKAKVQHYNDIIPEIKSQKTNKELQLFQSNKKFHNSPTKIRSRAMFKKTTTEAMPTIPTESDEERQYETKFSVILVIDIILVVTLIVVITCIIYLWILRKKKLQERKNKKLKLETGLEFLKEVSTVQSKGTAILEKLAAAVKLPLAK
ncbi:hypothetical protein XENTR_v10016456 [Xenopus tropicalis]|nr:hypothetical protein XENTR_v10016456 [Xenopus tropicalis]